MAAPASKLGSTSFRAVLGPSGGHRWRRGLLSPARRVTRTAATAVLALFVLGIGAVTTRPGSTTPLSVPAGLAVSSGIAAQAPFDPLELVSLASAVEDPRPAEAPAPVETAIMSPVRFDAPPAPAPPPPAALRAPLPASGPAQGVGTWAVIVGINDYPGTRSDLRSAVNDANDMDAALAGMGVPAQNRLVLRDGQATGSAIRRSVEWLVANAGEKSTAVLFYGGHVRKLDVATEAMVAADGEVISDHELAERLSRLNARRTWIAVAACYGGGFTELLAPGRVLTGAAGANSVAYETSQYGRSYMVEFMVRQAMIENRASSSVQAAFAYAASELARMHPGRQPVQVDTGMGPLDLRPVLVAPPAPAAPPAPPVPPSTPPTTTCRQLVLFTCSSR